MGASSTTPERLKVGELASRTGKTVRALHLYEEMGLLRPVLRTGGGYRLYGPDEVARVYWIAKLQGMGFSLGQIQGLLAAVEASKTAPEAMQGVRSLFRSRLTETREQVSRLTELERDLMESLAYLEGCRACDEAEAPSVCAMCDERHADRHGSRAPALVAGLRLPMTTSTPAAVVRLDSTIASVAADTDRAGGPSSIVSTSGGRSGLEVDNP